jgi:hypothetical protein
MTPVTPDRLNAGIKAEARGAVTLSQTYIKACEAWGGPLRIWKPKRNLSSPDRIYSNVGIANLKTDSSIIISWKSSSNYEISVDGNVRYTNLNGLSAESCEGNDEIIPIPLNTTFHFEILLQEGENEYACVNVTILGSNKFHVARNPNIVIS